MAHLRPTECPDPDPNDWNDREPICLFINREYKRLREKIPAEFAYSRFRIYFTAVADGPDGPIMVNFRVAMSLAGLGILECQCRNPFVGVMQLISEAYKEYAKLAQEEQREQHRRQQDYRRQVEQQECTRRYWETYDLLAPFTPLEVADMVERGTPLPPGVTDEMVEKRLEELVVEHVRRLSDTGLQQASPPAWLPTRLHRGFPSRCLKELTARQPVRECYEFHRGKTWAATGSDYMMFLDLWDLCKHELGILEDVMYLFFHTERIVPRESQTLESLLKDAPKVIKQARSDKGKRLYEARRDQHGRKKEQAHVF